MKGSTHLMSGVFLALFLYLFGFVEHIPSLVLLVFFTVFPDVDLYTSKIGKFFSPFSYIFTVFLGHRNVLHSFWPIIMLYVVLLPLGVAVSLLGYVLHLALDMLTAKGIYLFWPFVPVKGFSQTGGLLDIILLVLFSIGSGMLLLLVLFH